MSKAAQTTDSRQRGAILAIFVLSGAAGLVYEIVWSRQLVLVFGNTTQAVAAILTGYFGGMAIGNLVGGSVADRTRSPLRLYGVLELLLAGVVLVTPPMFVGIREVYRSAYGTLEAQQGLLAAIRFGLALLALAPATVLMGATLPSLSRHLSRRSTELGENFGRLYTANTVGAIVGAAAAGFVLIELVGLSASLLVGATGSAAAGLLALVIGRRLAASTPEATRPPTLEPALLPTERLLVTDLRRTSLVVAFVSGLTSLGYQTLWTRLLSSGSGGLSYVFSTILVYFLVGLALGAIVATTAGRRGIDIIAWLGRAQLLIALLACGGTIFIAFRPIDLPLGIAWLVVVLPTAVAIGLSLPLASRLAGSDDTHVGADTGRILGANTIGVVVGTVIIPFLAMPTLGSPLTVFLLALVNVALGAWLIGIRGTRHWVPDAVATAFVGCLVIVTALAGLARDPSVVRVERGGRLLSTAEDEIASVQAGIGAAGPQLWVGGTSMTAMTVDARLMAVLPAISRPDARSLLVIAFGMGSSYRTGLILGNDVEGVELVPSVPKMFGWFYTDAAAVLAEPRGRLVIADGRNHVELTDHRFGMVVVDPPPPIQSAGTGVLYSREFYQAAARVLADGGVMMEWMPYGQMIDEFLTHVRTFASVFPQVTLAFGPGGNGVFMLGATTPVRLDDAAVRSVLKRPGVTENLSTAPDSPEKTADGWASLIPKLVIASGDAVSRAVGPGDVITDDRPLTEYFMLRHFADRAAVRMSRQSIVAAFAPVSP